ncbi:MAG: discoidin domain-containing protein [Desulfomonilaceae bacterium]
MTESGQPKDSTSLDEKVESSKQMGTPNIARTKTRGWGGRIGRFLLICLYIGFLTAVVLAAFAGIEYYAYLRIKSSPVGEAYKNRDMDVARQSSQKVAPQFGYEPTPGFAAIRNTRLGNSYEYINEESFKDFEDVPQEKPADEYRVLVTGASVVYGRGPVPPADAVADYYEVTFRWTIPHIMEEILNADPRVREKIQGKKVRVINAGVPGYVYQNNLMRYLAKLRLFHPDLVVALDGANEVHTVARPLKDWNYFTEGPYFEVVTEVMDMSPKGLMNYLTLWLKRNTYFFTWLAMKEGEGPGILMENRGFAAHPQDATPEMIAYRDSNIAQVADVAAIYHKVLETDRVPHVFALQPMFRNSKKKRTPMEEKIEQVTGMQKIGFYDAAQTYQAIVDRLKKRAREIGFEVVDLTGIYDDVTEWVFTDWCHLTNGANYILAKELANRVKTQVFGLALLADDSIKNSKDAYFQDYAKNAKVLIDDKPVDSGLHILKGYPGTQLLEARQDGSGGAPRLMLDLGAVMPVSRLRIVWGDDKSVPENWQAELSEDGQHWKPWLTVNKTHTDSYDQWPGFEYYSSQETPARYVRYVPSGEGASAPIRLRQLSVFR